MVNATKAFDLHRRAVRAWLLAVAALVFAMVVVGGTTRLTESGLSIVEWQPVTGALPPLSEADWQAQFDKYKAIPQYQALNPGMRLDQFKTIYWWEWAHRQLGRLTLAAFLLPFLWFLWKGWVEPALRPRLWMIFGLGAIEGAVGWWMVASGLAGRTEVSQYRLAFHLTLACLIYALIISSAQRLAPPTPLDASRRVRAAAALLLALVLVQIYLGALVAGLRAGLIYNSWPLIDGRFLPAASQLFFSEPWWRNFFENPLTVQLDHRMVGYGLWLAALAHALGVTRNFRKGSAVWWGALALAFAVTLQAALGILTLLEQAPLTLALLHQGGAMVVLTVAVLHAQQVTATAKGLSARAAVARTGRIDPIRAGQGAT
jgi:cytochrome c oxidase assembly protein subunit 15